MMMNFQIIQTRHEIKNGWVVKADSIRFGRGQIMFEGSYEECWRYVETVAFVNDRYSVSVYVTGKRNGIEVRRLSVRKYNDGFTHFPQFEFPYFVLKTDIEKLNKFMA